MDSTIYAIVLQPALNDLLLPNASNAAIEWYGGIIFSLFLLGWALGGVLFGLLADYFGRTRILIATILLYSLFTGLAALSHSWVELLIFRFLTALGIGGEWAAGAALVAETWPDEKRASAAGILQSAWAGGFFLAALANLYLGRFGWRILFTVGILPAFATLLIRFWVREPVRWTVSRKGLDSVTLRESAAISLARLFSPEFRKRTMVGSLLAFVAVFGLWGATNWTPTLVRQLLSGGNPDPGALNRAVSYAVMSLNIGALAGYLSFGPLANAIGRRGAFFVMCLGSFVLLPAVYFTPKEYATLLWLLPLLGFFNNGIFSGFPIYLPELYPTSLRATGVGFCFNIGRIAASAGPFLKGYLGALFGPGKAASLIGLVYLVGIVTLIFADETKGRPLPD
jgi:MFS family permease